MVSIIIILEHISTSSYCIIIHAVQVLSFLAHYKLLRKFFIFATFINRTIASIIVVIVLSIALTSQHLIVFDKLLRELIFDHTLTNLTISQLFMLARICDHIAECTLMTLGPLPCGIVHAKKHRLVLLHFCGYPVTQAHHT